MTGVLTARHRQDQPRDQPRETTPADGKNIVRAVKKNPKQQSAEI